MNFISFEREMDNRGTKSRSGLNTLTGLYHKPGLVKAQRSDGNWRNIQLLRLRFGLIAFERKFSVRIPFYSHYTFLSRTYSTGNIPNKAIKFKYTKLNPWFITGFADAESSFIVLVQPRSDSKTKWRVKASFAIGLHQKDKDVLEMIKFSFGVGQIYYSETKVYYRVENFKELQVIVDHFDKYKLVTAKKIDYALFKQWFNIIKLNEHLTEKGLLNIINLKASLNKGLSGKLREQFPGVENTRVAFNFEGIPDPYWVTGFTSGDGSFNIKTTESRQGKVQLRYAVTLHIREKEVILGLAKYFSTFKDIDLIPENPSTEDITAVKYVYYTETSVAIQIVNFSEINHTIIPFFDKYPLQGQKRFDFDDFKIAAEIMKRKEHLSEKGYSKILQIKQGMNLNRL